MNAPPPHAPKLLDERYQIVRELGEGGMGQVYEGLHVVLRRKVAIKVLSDEFASDARSRKRLLREARAAAVIRHPNVVETIDFGETAHGSVFLVMEMLEGRDLRVLLREDGALPWPRVHALVRQAASALQAAHDEGIIHRDIKPSNCFVCPVEDGEHPEVIKLLDFGIAKLDDSSITNTGLTGTGQVLGTATYMAPELVLGEVAGIKTDIYSLGIMTYELLTGSPPFSGSNPYEVLHRHIEEEPVPLRQHVASIPTAVEAVVLRAIAKKPEERYASMAELEAALAAIPAPAWTPGSANAQAPTGAAGGPDSGRTELMDPAQFLGDAPGIPAPPPFAGPSLDAALPTVTPRIHHDSEGVAVAPRGPVIERRRGAVAEEDEPPPPAAQPLVSLPPSVPVNQPAPVPTSDPATAPPSKGTVGALIAVVVLVLLGGAGAGIWLWLG